MVVLIIVALVCAVMGILILMGKGDNLIAGYNTASKEERERYDIKRLRGLIGGLMIVLAPLLLMLGKESMASTWSFCGIVLVLCIVVVILANTWAKKKSQ